MIKPAPQPLLSRWTILILCSVLCLLGVRGQLTATARMQAFSAAIVGIIGYGVLEEAARQRARFQVKKQMLKATRRLARRIDRHVSPELANAGPTPTRTKRRSRDLILDAIMRRTRHARTGGNPGRRG